MAKKIKQEKHIHNSVAKKKEMPAPKWIVPFILLLAILAYIPSLNAGFVNWDDPDYIVNNYLIKDISEFSALFTTPIQGNFHPLTMLSLAVNYSISALEPWSYHLFNLIFHLVNCFLVFRLVTLLSNKKIIIAFTAAVLFAIHPMHVESVAWASERKDVLYTLFFLAALIAYTKFADTQSKKQYFLSFLFLLLSLLSKPAAIVFPLVTFSIDLLRKRKLTLKLCLEKVPFLTPVIVLGILTFNAQTDVGATGAAIFDFGTRILMAFYGIMMYIVKLFIPYNLSPFYPFPPINESLPITYYLGPVFFIALALLFYFSMKKNRVFAFGIFFYLANLVLVLQILPVGSAVIAERYTYVSYIGIFYALGWLIDHYTFGNYKNAFYIIIPISILLSVRTYKQAETWKDSEALWDHAIETNPSSKAYSLRASLLRKEKSYDKALDYYNKAIELNVIDDLSYTNRGNVYLDLKKYDLAKEDFKKSISLNPTSHIAFDNLGALFAMQQKFDSALFYLNKAIKLKPDYKPPYNNRALTHIELKRYDDAIKDFEKYLSLHKVEDLDAASVYNTIGMCYRLQSKFQESLLPINKAIQLDPNPVFFMNRSYTYFGLKDLISAKRDAMIAKQNGVQIDINYATTLGL
jgi:protein O-mannosyl-transferase